MDYMKISDLSSVGAARRLAISKASTLGLNETDVGKLAIVVTELASNIVKHTAGEGYIFLRILTHDNAKGVEVLAIDKGPGINNIAQCLQDGYSTAGTAGTGLGAVTRLSTLFDIYTFPQKGTIVVAEVWNKSLASQAALKYWVGAIKCPKPGQFICGDHWEIVANVQQIRVLIADGLGHGPEAAQASQLACNQLKAHDHMPLKPLVKLITQSLKNTRGAALAVAELDLTKGLLHFIGLGNINSVIVDGQKMHHLLSYDGTAGIGQPHIHEMTYSYSADAILILHSDGIATRWDLNRYPGILAKHPSIIAGILYRDFCRGYDDVSIVVIRENCCSGAEIK